MFLFRLVELTSQLAIPINGIGSGGLYPNHIGADEGEGHPIEEEIRSAYILIFFMGGISVPDLLSTFRLEKQHWCCPFLFVSS